MVGSADLSTRTNVVNNVYVLEVEEVRRGRIARALMAAMEEAMDRPRTLSLNVMMKNAAAVGLYKSLGFQALGLHGGLDPGVSGAGSVWRA